MNQLDTGVPRRFPGRRAPVVPGRVSGVPGSARVLPGSAPLVPGRALVTAVVLVLAAVTGCGAPPAAPDREPAASGALPRPMNVQDPAVVTSVSPPPACDARASLRPRGSNPRPGKMPSGSTMQRIAKRGRLIVGIDQNAYLFGFRDPSTGQLVGFEIDIAREIARDLLGDPEAIQFRAITTADRIPVIQRGEVDMVVRTVTMTCERWQQISFSTEYLSTRQRLLVNRGSGVRDFADLSGRKVCATRGSTSIRTIAAARSRPIPVATDSTLDCLVLLQQGQVDAVSTIDVLLAGLAAQDPGTQITGAPITDEPAGIGISRDAPDLVRFVNGVLERIRADGTWKRIFQRWLARLGPVSPPPAKYRD